jgi:hypothetical protein
MSEDPDTDEQLMSELRAFFAEVDPVPSLVTETPKASLGWRRLDADLAELLSDSALEEESSAVARGGGAPVRAVTFSSGSLTIDIEVHVDDQTRTLLGQLSPPEPVQLEIQTVAGARSPLRLNSSAASGSPCPTAVRSAFGFWAGKGAPVRRWRPAGSRCRARANDS